MTIADVSQGADFYTWLRVAVPTVIPVASVIIAYLALKRREPGLNGIDFRLERLRGEMKEANYKLREDIAAKTQSRDESLRGIYERIKALEVSFEAIKAMLGERK